MNNALAQPTFFQRNRLLIKAFLVGVLVLVLLIPTIFIENLVSERQDRRVEVAREVSNKWSGEQTVTGPYLVIPYAYTNPGSKHETLTRNLYLLPDSLTINAHIFPVTKARSIYKVPVYSSDLTLEGKFDILKSLEGIPINNFHFNDARLCVGITDLKGINDDISLKWNGIIFPFDTAPSTDMVLTEGVSTKLPLTADNIFAHHQFSMQVRLKGSEKMFFTPLGATTEVHMESPWTNPAFDGKYLPDSHTISSKGLVADWKILHFNRNFKQAFTNVNQAVLIHESGFGINFLEPVDAYVQTIRSIKYAILLISLTFFLYFFIEILQRKSIHPLQYILVGFALVVFYSLLLSISEYTSFGISYLISGLATISLIGWYIKSIFSKWKIALIFSAVIGLLYLFIYILIQLQDYALLFGTIGLFILLASVMYFSRKVDWYSTGQEEMKPILQA